VQEKPLLNLEMLRGLADHYLDRIASNPDQPVYGNLARDVDDLVKGFHDFIEENENPQILQNAGRTLFMLESVRSAMIDRGLWHPAYTGVDEAGTLTIKVNPSGTVFVLMDNKPIGGLEYLNLTAGAGASTRVMVRVADSLPKAMEAVVRATRANRFVSIDNLLEKKQIRHVGGEKKASHYSGMEDDYQRLADLEKSLAEIKAAKAEARDADWKGTVGYASGGIVDRLQQAEMKKMEVAMGPQTLADKVRNGHVLARVGEMVSTGAQVGDGMVAGRTIGKMISRK
jgi:hypothetical protein